MRHVSKGFTLLICVAVLGGTLSAETDQPSEPLPDEFSKASKEAFDLLDNAMPSAADVTVEIVGEQGRWTSTYMEPPGPTIVAPSDKTTASIAEAGGDLVVPLGKNVVLIFTSRDQIYELAIPDLNRVMSAIPGRLEMVELIAIPKGRFGLVCTAGCASGARAAPFAIQAVSSEDYDKWLRSKVDMKQ